MENMSTKESEANIMNSVKNERENVIEKANLQSEEQNKKRSKQEEEKNCEKAPWYLSIFFIVFIYFASGCLLGIPALILVILRFKKCPNKKCSNVLMAVIISIGIGISVLISALFMLAAFAGSGEVPANNSEIIESEVEDEVLVEEDEVIEESKEESEEENSAENEQKVDESENVHYYGTLGDEVSVDGIISGTYSDGEIDIIVRYIGYNSITPYGYEEYNTLFGSGYNMIFEANCGNFELFENAESDTWYKLRVKPIIMHMEDKFTVVRYIVDVVDAEPLEMDSLEVLKHDGWHFFVGDTIMYQNDVEMTIVDAGMTEHYLYGKYIYVTVDMINNGTEYAHMGPMIFYGDNYVIEGGVWSDYDDAISSYQDIAPGRAVRGTFYYSCEYNNYEYIEADYNGALVVIKLPAEYQYVEMESEVFYSNDIDITPGIYKTIESNSIISYANIGEYSSDEEGYYINITANDNDSMLSQFYGSIVPLGDGNYEAYAYEGDTKLLIQPISGGFYISVIVFGNNDSSLNYLVGTYYFESGIDYSEVG